MKRISNILRRVRAIVENRIRIHALISIKPNDSTSAFRLLQSFGWCYFQLDSGVYLLSCDIPLPKKCLDVLEKATHMPWLFAHQNDLIFKQTPKEDSIVENLLAKAFHTKASDIFLTLNKNFASLKFRIKRNLTEPEVLPR